MWIGDSHWQEPQRAIERVDASIEGEGSNSVGTRGLLGFIERGVKMVVGQPIVTMELAAPVIWRGFNAGR